MASERFKGDTNFNSGGVVGGYSSADAVGATSPTLIVLRLDPVTNRLLTSTTGEVSIQEEVPTDSTKNNPSYELDYTSDELTQLDMTVGTTVYRRTLTWTSNNLTAMTEWSEV